MGNKKTCILRIISAPEASFNGGLYPRNGGSNTTLKVNFYSQSGNCVINIKALVIDLLYYLTLMWFILLMMYGSMPNAEREEKILPTVFLIMHAAVWHR